jgi:hypothetical protein
MRCFLVVLLAIGCHRETDEDEELDETRLNYWRVQIAIVGEGRVDSAVAGFACTPAGGACGPRLVAFVERAPALLRATGAAGWRFARWESRTREADGRVVNRAGRMPDGRFYLNGFGYADTGALETVTAVFVPDR